MRMKLRAAALAGTVLLAGCNLDRTNPNAPTQEAVLSTPEGIIAVAVGVQARYGQSTADFIYSSGLVTDELGAISSALVTISDAEGGFVAPGAGFVASVWNSSYRTVKSANDLIAKAPGVALDPATRSGIMALAYTLKAAALGDVLQSFRELPIDTYGKEQPTFVSRAVALDAVLALLDTAESTLNALAPSPEFTGTILARGFDLRNTIFAYRARYLRLKGDNAGAITATNEVSRTVFSVLPYDAVNRNPVFTFSSGSSGVLPRDEFRVSGGTAEAARVAFHVTAAAITGRIGTPLDNFARYGVNSASIPLYYPDEPRLIKAEALTNLGQLAEAQAVLDSVRTDCGGLVPNDPNPCLPALVGTLTAPELLAEIYLNRRYELFATGLRWEDTRRLGLVGRTSAGKRCWLPYPIGERNANKEVPADPEGADAPAFPATCTS